MELYIDNKFCQNVSNYLQGSPLTNRKHFKAAITFYDLIDSKSLVFKNLPVSTNDFKRMFIDKVDFENLGGVLVDIDKVVSPFSIIFTDDLDSKLLRKSTGISIYSFLECADNYDLLFSKSSVNVKDEYKTWGEFGSKFLKFKSMIVSDNYLFFNEENNILDFLEALFKNQVKNCRYEILIRTSESKFLEKNGQTINVDSFFKEKFDTINELLSNKVKLKNYSLNFVLNDRFQDKAHHDRFIFTNLQIFESTNSFSTYFNCDSKIHEYSMISLNKNDIMFKTYCPNLMKIKKALNSRSSKVFSNGEFSMFGFLV